MAVTQGVREAWRANNQVNTNLLAHLTQEMMSARTPGGGMTVAEHLAHMTGTIGYWIELLAAGQMRSVPRLYDIIDDEFIAYTDLELFRERMTPTREAALDVVAAVPEGETGDAPHPSAEAVLLHILVHDAHHRGQIMLALKTAGFDLPGEDDLWLAWRQR
jgi:uncharacterized damage-inducible protein DinB